MSTYTSDVDSIPLTKSSAAISSLEKELCSLWGCSCLPLPLQHRAGLQARRRHQGCITSLLSRPLLWGLLGLRLLLLRCLPVLLFVLGAFMATAWPLAGGLSTCSSAQHGASDAHGRA